MVEKIEKAGMINVYHTSLFNYFLERLQDTPDGDGSLLDHSLLTYGGGLGDANMHEPLDLPIVLISRDSRIPGNRHIQFPKKTPLANLYLRMMDVLNIPNDTFGDSKRTPGPFGISIIIFTVDLIGEFK